MDYFNKNIKYKGASDKGLTIQLIDSEDNKWSIWKADYNNKDHDSDAYAMFKELKMGDEFGITYGEKPSSFVNDQGKTINFTQRTIYSILPVIDDVAIRTPKAVEKPHSEPNIASQGKQDDFGRRLAIHGMVNGLLANPNTENISTVKLLIPDLLELEDYINEALSKPKGWDNLGAKLKESVVTDLEEDIQTAVENIPF